MPQDDNQIKTRLAKLASEKRDPREPFPEFPIDMICLYCHFPIGACDCSRYDSEGNEL